MTDVKSEMLKKILESMTITDTGAIRWQGSQSSQCKRYTSLLLSDLMLDNNFQSKLNNLRYHFTPENHIFFGSELNSIFKEMKQENKSAFSDFKEKLNLMLQKIERDSKPVKFELYYPLNIKTDEKIDIIKFRDIEIEIKNYADIKDNLEDGKIKDTFHEKLTKHLYKYIKVTLWARNQHYVVEVATKYTNLILGFIAYSQNYQNSSITIAGIPKELTQLKLNFIFVFKENSYSGNYHFDDKSDDKKIYILSKIDISNLNNFVKQFDSADKRTQEIIYKAISSYYSGLIEKRIDYSFLNLWVALEIISLKKKGTPHIEIVKRLKSIIINLTTLDEHNIDRLYSLRNNLVHNGNYEKITQFDRNLLKLYTELMIEFFMSNLLKYNIQEIQQIFQFLQKDNKTLEDSKRLIDYVIKLRVPIEVKI